jgi:hypothetical protein
MLACGPFIDENGLLIAALLLVAFKPPAYYAFIQAFRYRVSRPIPMRRVQALRLTLLRAGLGIALLGVGAAVVAAAPTDEVLLVSWIYLYAGRAGAWLVVGRWGARLRGRRLAGWTVSGTLINAAFDVAIVLGIFDGWAYPVAILAGLAACIGVLDLVGRRPALRERFTVPLCAGCSYDLTGNLSGRCPECGRAVMVPA